MRYICLFLGLWISQSINAQLPDDYRSEQIALQLGEATLLPGDSLDVEGQVTCMAPDRFLPYSQYVYVECISGADSVLCRQKVSCKDKGYFRTRLGVDYDWLPGIYYVRAYTRLMMNFGADGFPVRPFGVSRELPGRGGSSLGLRCQMSIVGGTLLSDCLQRIVFSLQDEEGQPVSMPLHLTNEKGDTITSTQTSRAGLALLRFIPQQDCRYFLTTESGETFELPMAATGGCQIHGDLKGNRISYRIQGTEVPESFRLCTYDRRNGVVEYDMGQKSSGIILLNGHPEVVSLFLTDKEGKVMSESTLCAPVSRDRSFPEMSDTLWVGDTLRYVLPPMEGDSRIWARVVSDDQPAYPMEASLRYEADYKSPLPFPVSVYASSETEARNDLYMWLCSAGFKRFDLKEVLQKRQGMYRYMPEENLVFKGKVMDTNGRPLKGGHLVAYHTGRNFVYDTDVESDGSFAIAVDDFQEGESFYLQGQSAKGKFDYYTYLIDNDTFPSVSAIRRYSSLNRNDGYLAAQEETGTQWTDTADMRNIQLPEVEIKARLRGAPPKSTQKFYEMNYVDRKKMEDYGYRTLYEVFQSMPGIQIRQGTDNEDSPFPTYRLHSTRGASTLSSGGSEKMNGSSLVVLLDGFRMDENDMLSIMNMPLSEVESVELLKPWQTIAVVGGAIDGCVCIKTRAVSVPKPEEGTKGIYYTPLGLSGALSPQQPERLPWIADKPGRYNLFLDVVTDTDVRSYVCPFQVVSQ